MLTKIEKEKHRGRDKAGSNNAFSPSYFRAKFTILGDGFWTILNPLAMREPGK